MSVTPTKPVPANPAPIKPSAAKSPPAKPSPRERKLANEAQGAPLPDSKGELPPVIRRTEVVAFALVALLIIVMIVRPKGLFGTREIWQFRWGRK